MGCLAFLFWVLGNFFENKTGKIPPTGDDLFIVENQHQKMGNKV